MNDTTTLSSPFFIRRKSLPIWISGVAVFIIVVLLYGQLYQIEDKEQAISFLNTNAGLLVTTLAVTMSFTLLGIQFMAESYTPRALTGYLKDKVVYGFPVIYIALITLNLVSSAAPSIIPPIKFLQFAVGGTIFSLVYLVAFVDYIINKIQPESFIMEISRRMQSDARMNIVQNEGLVDISSGAIKPFIILQQVMNKAVKQVTFADI